MNIIWPAFSGALTCNIYKKLSASLLHVEEF